MSDLKNKIVPFMNASINASHEIKTRLTQGGAVDYVQLEFTDPKGFKMNIKINDAELVSFVNPNGELI